MLTHRLILAVCLLSFVVALCFSTTTVTAQLGTPITSGTFSAITINVDGLPVLLQGGSDRTAATRTIGQKLRSYIHSVVNVQEDFNYHSTFYDEGVTTAFFPYRTATSGGAGVGSGLNTVSTSFASFSGATRVQWSTCNSNDGDCLTPKGFSLVRATIVGSGGPYFLDVYNLHADAGSQAGDISARQSNLDQLAAYINANSVGNAVIVFGDTNCRYTRDTLKARLIDAVPGLQDVWIQLIRGGSYPSVGSLALTDGIATGATSPNNEVVDKIFYRSGPALTLTPTSYKLENVVFTDSTGAQLSDHYPVISQFSYSVGRIFRLSDDQGGSGGNPFNFFRSSAILNLQTTAVFVQAGARIDAVGFVYGNSVSLVDGGSGGTYTSLALGSGEVVWKIEAWFNTDVLKGITTPRLFGIVITSSWLRTLSAGSQSGTKYTYTSPANYYIAGFKGRSGTAIDRLGVIYKSL